MHLRNLVATAVVVLATAVTAGCAAGESSSAAEGPTQSAATGATPEGSFPAVVAHQYGETTVPSAPERVVSVGVTEQDILLELGVVPVAVTEWYGEQPSATWPWARPLLDGAEPEVLSVADGFEFERIAALEPDLIVGTNAGMTERDYELLSAIAPDHHEHRGRDPVLLPRGRTRPSRSPGLSAGRRTAAHWSTGWSGPTRTSPPRTPSGRRCRRPSRRVARTTASSTSTPPA